MVYNTKMEEDDDLEALRLAALQTIRPRSTRIVPLNTTKLDKAAFVRPVNNPNLITIIPLETIIKEEPVVVAPVEKKEVKKDPPESNLSRPASDELDSVQVETKFSRFRDSDSDSDDKMSACSLEYHHSPSEDEQKESVRKKRPSNDSDEDLLALNEEDNDSLEKLMDEMEQEFSQTDTKSAANTASADSGPAEKKSKGGGEERRSKGSSARRYSGRKKRSHSPRRRRRSKTSGRSSRSRSPLRRPSGRSSSPPRRTSWSPPRPPRKAAPTPPPSPPQPQAKERSSDKRSMKVWKSSERKPAEETVTKQREDASTGEAGAGPATAGGGAMPVNPVLEARRKKFESKSPVLVAPVKKKIRLKRAPATPTQETKLPSEARRIIVRQEPRQPEDRKTVLQRRKISVNIKPTALIDLEEKSKKISVHKMERDSSSGVSKKDNGGAAMGGKASPSDTTTSGEAEERAKAKANDLRAELSRRRAQRLKSAIDILQAPTRLLQSAFEGVVGKKAARIRKAVSPENTVPKLNLTGSKGRRVQVVRREPPVSLPLESGMGEPKRSSVDHGMREVHWAGGSQSIVGRSILHRSQV